MNILMLGWEYPPHNSGGLGVACHGLATSLVRNGISITFVLPRKIPIKETEGVRFLFTDIPFLSYSTSAYPTTPMHKSKTPFYGSTLFNDVISYRDAISNIVRNCDFDIVHAHDWLTFGAGIEAKNISHKPLITQVHATEFDRTAGLSRNESVYSFEKEGFDKADQVVAVSHYTKKVVNDNYKIPLEKIHVIHNGSFQTTSSCPSYKSLKHLKKSGLQIVLFMGRLTIQKGPDYFIRAAKHVLSENSNLLFIVAGSGDMQNELINQVSYWGLSDKILFTGFVRGEEWQCLLEAADLYVMPSVSEPFGIMPLEALREGVPVIISNQSGVKEVLEHALVVNFWDTEELAHKILSCLLYKPLHNFLKEGGTIDAERCSWQNSAEKCIELYRSMIPSNNVN